MSFSPPPANASGGYTLIWLNSKFIVIVLHLPKIQEEEYKAYSLALSLCFSTHDRANAQDFNPAPCKHQTMSTSSLLACKSPITTSANFGLLFNCFLPCTIIWFFKSMAKVQNYILAYNTAFIDYHMSSYNVSKITRKTLFFLIIEKLIIIHTCSLIISLYYIIMTSQNINFKIGVKV